MPAKKKVAAPKKVTAKKKTTAKKVAPAVAPAREDAVPAPGSSQKPKPDNRHKNVVWR